MQIRIASAVLNDTRWHPLLDVVVDFVDGVDSRLSYDPRQIRELLSSPWLAGANGIRGTLPKLVQASFRAASRGTPSTAVTVCIDDTAPKEGETSPGSIIRIHPLGCLSLLHRPFYLIVEDEVTDGGFLLWMARLLGRDEIIRAYVSGRLAFRHAGGKGQIVKSASALSVGIWPRPGRTILAMHLRSAVLLDSDAKFPGHTPNATIVAQAGPWVAFTHLLAARTIENYVPQKYFRRRMDRDGVAELSDNFFRLTEDQRAYFPIKKGFANSEQPPRPQTYVEFSNDPARPLGERNHFHGVSAGVWAEIAKGFGERLSSVFTNNEYRCEPGDYSGLAIAHRIELSNLISKLLQFL